jgi:hypothetical protein
MIWQLHWSFAGHGVWGLALPSQQDIGCIVAWWIIERCAMKGKRPNEIAAPVALGLSRSLRLSSVSRLARLGSVVRPWSLDAGRQHEDSTHSGEYPATNAQKQLITQSRIRAIPAANLATNFRFHAKCNWREVADVQPWAR